MAEENREPVVVDGGVIENVQEFPYLGSVNTISGRVDADVEARLVKASEAFGALRRAVIGNKNLMLITKSRVYQACVLSVLLYGARCWTSSQWHIRKMDTFHRRCICAILGISNWQQWTEKITMAEIRKRWGDEETVGDKVQR